jgi:small subunit ribosomal protein S13
MAGKDLDGERNVELALSDLKGIGHRLSAAILKKLDIPGDKRIGELGEEHLDTLREFIESKEYADFPDWMLNHRREIISGKNVNLVSNDLDLQFMEDINIMRKSKSYKGVRHETGHKVRGQKTRSNGRKGLAIGVIKKKEGQPQTQKA